MFDKGSQCRKVFENVEYVYRVCHALGRSWQYLQPERRQESIDLLRKKLVSMADEVIYHTDKHNIQVKDTNAMFEALETLEQYNKGEGTIHNLPELLEGPASALAINAIANCACPTDKEGV